jgi:hypothetical protein
MGCGWRWEWGGGLGDGEEKGEEEEFERTIFELVQEGVLRRIPGIFAFPFVFVCC